MDKKYNILEESIITPSGRTLYRIQAIRDFADVKVGEKGGFIEREENLSQEGNSWISGDARVYGKALVCGDARVYGKARVYDDAMVCGDAQVYGEAEVCGKALVSGDAIITKDEDYIVFKNWWSSGRYFTWTRSNNMWSVGCFYGSGEELVEKAYKDSLRSGQEYERIVNYVKEILEQKV